MPLVARWVHHNCEVCTDGLSPQRQIRMKKTSISPMSSQSLLHVTAMGVPEYPTDSINGSATNRRVGTASNLKQDDRRCQCNFLLPPHVTFPSKIPTRHTYLFDVHCRKSLASCHARHPNVLVSSNCRGLTYAHKACHHAIA